MMPSVTREEFAAWWDDLNRDFPPYKFTVEDLAKQARIWFDDLRHHPKLALEDSLRAWRRTQERRPKLAHILAGCVEYQRRISSALDIRAKRETVSDGLHCDCGCGGIRWAQLLVDTAGAARTVLNKATGELITLTRDHVECRRMRLSQVPGDAGEFVERDERGVPVWRLIAVEQEAAA